MESEQCSAPSLDAIQRADDISATLRLAREAILANDRFCQEVEEQCALNITKIWEYIDQRERSEPHHARLIHQWRQEITQAIRHQTIEHYKTLAAASQHRIDRYRVRIRQAWGVESSQVLEPKHYKQGQGLSHECLRSLAHLSEHVPLETGRGLLIHQIQHRTLSKVTGFRDTDVHLKPRDVKRALAATGVQTAETAESSDLDPSASAPAPRGHSTEPQSQPPTNRPSGQAPRRKRKTNYFYSSKGKLRKLPEVARSVSPSFTHASNTTDVDPVVDPDADSVVDSAARSGEEEAVTINGECTPDIELARTQTGPNLSVLDSPNWTHSPVPSETGSGVDLESMASRDSHVSLSGSMSHSEEFPGEPSDVHAIGAEPQSMLEHAYRGAAQAHDVASIDVMPESTLQAALNSLVPGERLTTTAMDWILGSFNADRYKFLDPACLDCETPGSQAPRPSTSDWSSTEFMIPMYHVEEHWTLGTLEAGRANLYDSLRSTMHEKDAEKVLGACYQSQFGGDVSGSLPTLELKPCQTPQQDNGVDCGMYVVIAAMYLMARRPLPECFHVDTWRFVLRVALDVSISQSDDRPPEPPSSPHRLEPPNSSVDPTQHACAEIARREHHQADLRKRVEHMRRASASLNDRVQGLDEVLELLTVLQQQRDGLHVQIGKEQEIHTAECAKIERLMRTIPGYGFALSQAAIEQVLAEAHAKAISSRDKIDLSLGRSAVKQAVVAKAVAVAASLGQSYRERLAGIRWQQRIARDEIIEIERLEETLRAERGRWMEELQKIP